MPSSRKKHLKADGPAHRPSDRLHLLNLSVLAVGLVRRDRVQPTSSPEAARPRTRSWRWAPCSARSSRAAYTPYGCATLALDAVVLSALCILSAAGPTQLVFCVLLLGIGASTMLLQTSAISTAQLAIDDGGVRGRVMAILLVWLGGARIGGPLLGQIVQHFRAPAPASCSPVKTTP